MKIKLRQLLTKQYKAHKQYKGQNGNEQILKDYKLTSTQLGTTSRKDGKAAARQRSDSHSASYNTRAYSHRTSHYQNTRLARPHTVSEPQHIQITDRKPKELTESKPASEVMDASPSNTVTLGGLRKMSKRHEHLSKVRQAQNAAIQIQRAWRHYRKKTRSI